MPPLPFSESSPHAARIGRPRSPLSVPARRPSPDARILPEATRPHRIREFLASLRPAGPWCATIGKVLAVVASLTLGAPLAPAATAIIDADEVRQTIRGFGGATVFRPTEPLTPADLDSIFGNGDNQLGLTILRIRVAEDEAWRALELANAQGAIARGAIVLATPWSPPAAMKTNSSLIGGSLAPASYAAYATYLNEFARYMAANGADLYAISVQNEPDIEVTYESCDWTPDEMLAFCRHHSGAITAARVLAPESFQFRHNLSDPLLNNPEATANVAIIGGHIYGAGLARDPLAASRGKEVWMTEHLDLSTDWAGALATAKEIHDCLAVADFSAYIWWYVKRYYGPLGEDGLITKRGHVLSQFAKFIRPGYRRIGATSSPTASVYVSAYKREKLVIIAVNLGTVPVNQTFDLQHASVRSLRRWTTSSSLSLTESLAIEVSGTTFSASLPAGSVTTLVGDLAFPTLTTEPVSAAVRSGGSTTLAAAAWSDAPLSWQWYRNGRALGGATQPSLTLAGVGPAEAGLYDVSVTGATSRLSQAAVVGVLPAPGQRTDGSVTTRPEWQDIRHPNGATYDQFLMDGPAATFTAEPGQIARMSFLDPAGSIVQVEMSGTGALTVVLDHATGPLAPSLYNQPGITYMQGKPTLVLAGADATTHVSTYSVGPFNNPGVTRAEVSYAGWADVAALGIVSADGRLGGIHQGNVRYSASLGLTGIYAPTVTSLTDIAVVVHDVGAAGSALPYLYFGSTAWGRLTIAGGALNQPAGDAITVSGLARVTMGAGMSSAGAAAPAQPVQSRLIDDNDTDVTAALVVGP